MFVVEFVVFCILFDEDVEVVGFGMILFDEGCWMEFLDVGIMVLFVLLFVKVFLYKFKLFVLWLIFLLLLLYSWC